MSEQDIKDTLFYLDEAEILCGVAEKIFEDTLGEWDARSMSFALGDPRGQRNALRNVKKDIESYLGHCRSNSLVLLEIFEDIRFFFSGVFTIKGEK